MYKFARIFGTAFPNDYIQQAVDSGDNAKALNIYRSYVNVKADEEPTHHISLLPSVVIGGAIGSLVAKKSGMPMAAVAGVAAPFIFGQQFKKLDDEEIERAKVYKTLSDEELSKILEREINIYRHIKTKHPYIIDTKDAFSEQLEKTSGWKKNLIIGGLAYLLYRNAFHKEPNPNRSVDVIRRSHLVGAPTLPVNNGPEIQYGYRR